MLVKCKQCGTPIRNAKTGTMCTSCGSTVSFMDIMESVKFVRMGKARGHVRRFKIGEDGKIKTRRFPTTHRRRKQFVAKRRKRS